MDIKEEKKFTKQQMLSFAETCMLKLLSTKPYATEIEFVKGRIKFGKLDENGNFFLPLNDKGKTQSGTKDSMIVVFDGRS